MGEREESTKSKNDAQECVREHFLLGVGDEAQANSDMQNDVSVSANGANKCRKTSLQLEKCHLNKSDIHKQ